MDPSAATFSMPSLGQQDAYVSQFDLNGNFHWSIPIGSTRNDLASDVKCDVAGNIYVTGSEEKLITPFIRRVSFLNKYDSTGYLIWKTESEPAHNGSFAVGNSIALDGMSAVYCIGNFTTQVDFDPDTTQSTSLSSLDSATADIFIQKLHNNCRAHFTIYPDTVVQHNWFALNLASGNPSISYLWNWGDGSTSTGPTPSHIYSAAANYNICLSISDGVGCSDTYCDSSTYIYKTEQTIISVSAVTQLPTGISSFSNQNSTFSIYPNPATTQLFIQTNGVEIEQINIYNTTGSLVRQTKTQTNSIDISELANGVYVAEIILPADNTGTKQVSVRKRWVKM